MPSQVAEVLRKALAAFGPNGEHWIKGHGALDARGNSVMETLTGKAVSWCSAGSIVWHENSGFQHYSNSAAYALVEELAGQTLHCWNDDPKRTFADVKALFEKAIAKAEKTQ